MPETDVWQAELLRATAFLEKAATGAESEWERLVQQEPRDVTVKPKSGIEQVEGEFEGCRLLLRYDDKRIDWVLIPGKTPEIPESITAVPLEQVLPKFMSVIDPWLGTLGPVMRLAFGAVVVQAVASREDGYRVLSRYISTVRVDPETTTDFLYQINRMRTSSAALPGQRINVLRKWSVQLFQRFAITPGMTKLAEASGPSDSAVRLEVDANTMPGDATLPTEKVSLLFGELIASTKDVMTRGDDA